MDFAVTFGKQYLFDRYIDIQGSVSSEARETRYWGKQILL